MRSSLVYYSLEYIFFRVLIYILKNILDRAHARTRTYAHTYIRTHMCEYKYTHARANIMRMRTHMYAYMGKPTPPNPARENFLQFFVQKHLTNFPSRGIIGPS